MNFQVGQNSVKQSDKMLYRFTAQEILCVFLGVHLKRADIKFKLREKCFNPDLRANWNHLIKISPCWKHANWTNP